MNENCRECGGMCCSFKLMDISYLRLDDGQTIDEFIEDHDLSNLLLQDGSVPDMEWHVKDGCVLVFHCNHLEDGMCSVYENRPGMCRGFECEVLEGELTLDEFQEQVGWDESVDEMDLVDVTDKMTEAIQDA